jgi:hypothetical protein
MEIKEKPHQSVTAKRFSADADQAVFPQKLLDA